MHNAVVNKPSHENLNAFSPTARARPPTDLLRKCRHTRVPHRVTMVCVCPQWQPTLLHCASPEYPNRLYPIVHHLHAKLPQIERTAVRREGMALKTWNPHFHLGGTRQLAIHLLSIVFLMMLIGLIATPPKNFLERETPCKWMTLDAKS